MKRRNDDDAYDPTVDEYSGKRVRNRNTNTKPKRQIKSKPMSKRKSQTFLTQNADYIVSKHLKGKQPHEIADGLSRKYALPDGAIPTRSVSNWLYYHKKSKQLKLRPVSQKNKNMRATEPESCEFLLFILSFFFFALCLLFLRFSHFIRGKGPHGHWYERWNAIG